MNGKIRPMCESDRGEVIAMMKTFYSSPAVLTDGSDEIFAADFENCVNTCPYLEGWVFSDGDTVLGYAMLAKSFSTEFGRQCVWIEDLYIKNDCRGAGLGGRFLEFVAEKYPEYVTRLEAENENEAAVNVYKKHGFKVLPYLEMIRHGGEKK